MAYWMTVQALIQPEGPPGKGRRFTVSFPKAEYKRKPVKPRTFSRQKHAHNWLGRMSGLIMQDNAERFCRL